MLTEKGKIQLEKIITTGNKIGLIITDTTGAKLIEKDLKLFDWEEKYGTLFSNIEFTDFEYIGFTVAGYYLKKDNTIFYSYYWDQEYLIKNKS